MKSVEDKFWGRVVKADGCWSWTGAKDKNGYGTFSPSATTGPLRAHRFSWEIHRGGIPTGLCVCHHCDNPECTNPEHLFVGTNKDNMEDKTRKGRVVGRGPSRFPEERYILKQSIGRHEKHLEAILVMRGKGDSLAAIAAVFMCDPRAIKRLLVRNGLYTPNKPGPRAPHRARTNALIAHRSELVARFEQGETITALAENFGISRLIMSKIIRTASIAAREEGSGNPRAA